MNRMVKEHKKHGRRVLCIFTAAVIAAVSMLCFAGCDSKSTEEKNLKDINRMAEATVKMVRDSVSAYVQKDLELARKVMDADDEVDDIFDLVKGDLVKFISDHKGSAGDEAIDLIMIAKYLERIGDHATNIAEWVEFSITGIHAGGTAI